MLAQFSFITAGQAYEVELPPGAGPLAESSGVFTAGELPRPLIYEPRGGRIDPNADPSLAPAFNGTSNGQRLFGYYVRQTPPIVAAFWHLKDGYVHTFMDDLVANPAGCDTQPDLVALLKEAVEHISVAETPYGPFAAFTSPLAPGDPRDLMHRDLATFFIDEGRDAGSVLRLRKEPAWAREGEAVSTDSNSAEVTVTTGLRVAVQARGPRHAAERLKRYASTAASSLTPLD
jgi:hypothetical protein